MVGDDVVLVVVVAVAGVITVGHGHVYDHDLLRLSRDWGGWPAHRLYTTRGTVALRSQPAGSTQEIVCFSSSSMRARASSAARLR